MVDSLAGQIDQANERRDSPLRGARTFGCQEQLILLELRIPRHAREWDHVADIRHAGYELNGPFQAETEAGVRHSAVTAQVQIPPVGFRVELLLAHPLFEHVE